MWNIKSILSKTLTYLTVVATLLAIFTFMTGITSIKDFDNKSNKSKESIIKNNNDINKKYGMAKLSFIGINSKKLKGISFLNNAVTPFESSDVYFNYYYGKPMFVTPSNGINGIIEIKAGKLKDIQMCPRENSLIPSLFSQYDKSSSIKIGYVYCVKINEGEYFAKIHVIDFSRIEEHGIHKETNLKLEWELNKG